MRQPIIRRFEFDAGHRVMSHEGKCRHFHGHRYVVEFHVSAAHLDLLGRVVDFGELKKELGPWIDDNLDHAFLAHASDFEALKALELIPGQRIFRMDGNPTAENLARLLHRQAEKLLKGVGKMTHDCSVDAVVVWETPNCRAEYRP